VGAVGDRAALARRVLLKLSGELLGRDDGVGLSASGMARAAGQIAGARRAGSEVAVVCGAGNLFRGSGSAARGMPRTSADATGLAATLVNALALAGTLARMGLAARVLSAFEVPRLSELHTPQRSLACLARGEIAILAGGTGNPFFTTDTAAAVRALELECTVLIKGTKVDGVYDRDPLREPDARRFAQISYAEVLARRLAVMDLTAVTLCMENRLPLVVLDATREGSVEAFLRGADLGTVVLPSADAPGGTAKP